MARLKSAYSSGAGGGGGVNEIWEQGGGSLSHFNDKQTYFTRQWLVEI